MQQSRRQSRRTLCGRAGRVVWRWSSGEQTSTRFLRRLDVRSSASDGGATRDPLARPVLVVRVLLQVKSAQPLRLLDERLLFGVGQLTPASTEPLADLGVVHVRSNGRDLLTLDLNASCK